MTTWDNHPLQRPSCMQEQPVPYSGPDDKSLPANVKSMEERDRARWVRIYNSALSRCERDGGKGCEASAFKQANGVLKSASYGALFGGKGDALGRAFVEMAGAEPPASINVFPAPGTYKHQLYGDIDVTEADNRAFVDNFAAQVYQEHIPIDAEHESKLSGAVGYLRALRMNDDGSIEADVEWTARGEKLIEQDSYRYISPEWYEEWEDPASGEKHKNVIVGAALTTRPFFKGLRSLVAAEGALYEEEDGGERHQLLRTAEGVSYNDLSMMVLSAARHEFPGLFDDNYGWVVDLYDDRAIISGQDGRYWSAAYGYGNDAITFAGQPQEVRRVTSWEEDDGTQQARETPINNAADLQKALSAYGRAKDKEAAKKYISARAKALGKTDALPADWPGSTKKKEGRMTVDVEKIDVGKLDEKDQRSLLTRAASALGVSINFGKKAHEGGGGNGDDDEEEDDETTDAEGKDKNKSEDGAGKDGDDGKSEEGKPDPNVPQTATEVKALKDELAAERGKREATEKRVATLEGERRQARFRDVILGRDDGARKAAEADPAARAYPMVGDLSQKLSIMETLAAASKDGEEGDAFKAYVAAEREHARQLHASGTFNEIGTDSHDEPANAANPERDMEEAVKAAQAKDDKLTYDQALAKVASEQPKLYDAYDRGVTGRKQARSGR